MKNKSSKYAHIKVLYIEDDKLVRTIVQERLDECVKELYVAENGDEGLALFKTKNPNLIITDLNMPVMSGIEFIKKIRSIDSSVPVIVTSALTDVDSFVKSIELKVEKYILKPFSPDEVLSAIDIMSRQIILSQLSASFSELNSVSQEQLETIQLVMRNTFTAIIKELVGKGAPRVNVKIKENKLIIYLYDAFLPYEHSLLSTSYESAFVNSLRKSLYEHYKQKIERKLTYSTGLTIILEDIRISITDGVEKFTFSVSNMK